MVQVVDEQKVKEFRGQPGPQTAFLASEADVVIYGGAAYGGKTFAMLMEGARHKDNPEFGFTIFRRSMPQIKAQGALWDESFEIYPHLGATPMSGDHSWRWPSGAEAKFSHLEDENTLQDYDGAQIALLGFDQLEQFTERQFFYMLSRNRSGCGVRPYCRATANPPRIKGGVDRHWLRNLLDWWIGKDGFPIKARCGEVRYFTRNVHTNLIDWVDESWRGPDGEKAKTLTFIAAKYSDNQLGLKKDPTYVSNLNVQARMDRLRVKEGNWDVNDEAGMIDPTWLKIVESAPPKLQLLRYWDRAATDPSEKNPNPDWTAGALGGLEEDGTFWIVDMVHFRGNPGENERRIRHAAEVDGEAVEIVLEEEGGSSGKDVVTYYQGRVLRGFTVHGDRPTGDKVVRAKPWSAKAERGLIRLVRGAWNHAFLAEVSTFPQGKKDQVDAVSGLHHWLTSNSGYDLSMFAP